MAADAQAHRGRDVHQPGDPLKIDCGYRSDRSRAVAAVVRMFHAVSLEADVEAAKVLA